MGTGRGAKRRASSPLVHGTLRRAKLEPMRHGRVVYTSYLEALSYRTSEGNMHWLYVVDEYGMRVSADTTTSPAVEHWRRRVRESETNVQQAMRSYAMLVSEDDLFWAVGAGDDGVSNADVTTPPLHWPPSPLEPVPYMHAIYWTAHPRGRLRDRDGSRCRVYAVEERRAGKGRRVPARYGVRFADDESYWVVPAREIVLAPTYQA